MTPETVSATTELLQRIAGHRFPVYLTEAFEPRATLDAGATSERVLICSVPKAGTYLLGGLLARFGMGDPHLHLNTHAFSDYRFAELTHARQRPGDLAVQLPLDVSIRLIGPGQFAVGHLPCAPEIRSLVAGFRIVVAIRDLRDAMLSLMRFQVATGRTGFGPADAPWRTGESGPRRFQAFLETAGIVYLSGFAGLADWLKLDAVQVVRFETLSGDHGRDAQVAAVAAVAAHTGITIGEGDAAKAIDDTLGASTLTWSGGRSRRDDFWDEEVAAVFAAIGGVEANRRFGYE
jgi:hypothetical protein